MRKIEDILHELSGPFGVKIGTNVRFNGVFRKDTLLYEAIRNAIMKISQDPFRGEQFNSSNLKIKGLWRVPIRHHSYALTYTINMKNHIVTIESYLPHDRAYKSSNYHLHK